MKEAYILDIIRTPIGKYGGVLASMRPDDLAAWVIRCLMDRNPVIEPASIEDVIFGAANQAGEDNRNVARMAALLAGLPVDVAGVTVNRLCGSGLQAVVDAARSVMTGEGDVFIAGGVESMSRAPYVMAKSAHPYGRNPEVYDSTIGWRFENPLLSDRFYPYSMGETAENVAEKWGISREAQDEFAMRSQLNYASAVEAGRFKDELVSVPIEVSGATSVVVEVDEHPRLTSLEKLASLKPAFRPNGTVTAGNSSGINDGASACLVLSKNAVERLNLKPMARVVAAAVVGVDPAFMGLGPAPATGKVLKRAGLTINDIDLVELNEAFAAQSLACIQELRLDPEIVNVNGGAIALGHPLGCSGTRISATLLHELSRRHARFGVATMCIGVGQGIAVVFENMNR
jgi:acetyl-CoA C-acetyltransferase